MECQDLALLRLAAMLLDRTREPLQLGWSPSLFNRPGLPQKSGQLLIKPMSLDEHHSDSQRFSEDSLL
uniref:Uncharacterized protein n=1 Tax=Anguilla anguilla TaxID=7936 RepID=A0A0E9XGQ0_ANGAN